MLLYVYICIYMQYIYTQLVVACWLCGACIFGFQWWVPCSHVSRSAVLLGRVGANIPQLFVVCTDIHSNIAFATRPLWDTAILGHKQSFLGVAMLQHVTAVSLNEANHVGQIWSRLLARALGQKRHKETKRAEDLSASFSIFQLSFGRTLCSSWAPHGTLMDTCHSSLSLAVCHVIS